MHRCDARPQHSSSRTDLWHSTRVNEVDGDEPQKAQKKSISYFEAIHTTDRRMGVGCGACAQWKTQQMQSQPTRWWPPIRLALREIELFLISLAIASRREFE